MADRIAPKDGYDSNGSKRQYRRDVWKIFSDWTRPRSSEAYALLMPSVEGTEVEVALSKRFREDHLVLYDKNTAIVASLKARRFQRVIAKGGYIGDVGARLAADGVRLTVANLDFTGSIQTVAREVLDFVESGVLAKASMIAVTMVKGREDGDTMSRVVRASTAFSSHVPGAMASAESMLLDAAKTGQDSGLDCQQMTERLDSLGDLKIAGRLGVLVSELAGPPGDPWFAYRRLPMIRVARQYKSGTQRMIWCVIKIHEQPCFCSTCHVNLLTQGASLGWSAVRVHEERREYYGLGRDADFIEHITERHKLIGYNPIVVPRLSHGERVCQLGSVPAGWTLARS